MSWLWESPLLIVAVGSAVTAVLAAIWLQTGRRPLAYAFGSAAVLTCGLLLLERSIQTDREQIETTLHRIARNVEQNDVEAVLQYVHSSASQVQKQVTAELPKYDFQRVSVKRNLEIQVQRDQEPRTILATFNVVVVLNDDTGVVAGRRIPRYVKVTFQQEGGAWRVVHYDHQNAREGFLRDR